MVSIRNDGGVPPMPPAGGAPIGPGPGVPGSVPPAATQVQVQEQSNAAALKQFLRTPKGQGVILLGVVAIVFLVVGLLQSPSTGGSSPPQQPVQAGAPVAGPSVPISGGAPVMPVIPAALTPQTAPVAQQQMAPVQPMGPVPAPMAGGPGVVQQPMPVQPQMAAPQAPVAPGGAPGWITQGVTPQQAAVPQGSTPIRIGTPAKPVAVGDANGAQTGSGLISVQPQDDGEARPAAALDTIYRKGGK